MTLPKFFAIALLSLFAFFSVKLLRNTRQDFRAYQLSEGMLGEGSGDR